MQSAHGDRCLKLIAALAFALGFFGNRDGWAQQKDYLINPYALDYSFLKVCIAERIDSVRRANRLPLLTAHVVPDSAAADHAAFLIRFPGSGHFQKGNKKRRTPAERIAWYGGGYSATAENIAVTYVQKPIEHHPKVEGYYYINLTYRQTARNLVEGWMNSPGHARNILTKKFNATGIAIRCNPDNFMLQAVQTFGAGEGSPYVVPAHSIPDSLAVLKHEAGVERTVYRGPKINRNFKKGKRFAGKGAGTQSITYYVVPWKNARRALNPFHVHTGLMPETFPDTLFDHDQNLVSIPGRLNQRSLWYTQPARLYKASAVLRTARTEFDVHYKDRRVKIAGQETPLKKRPHTFIIRKDHFSPSDGHLILFRKNRLIGVHIVAPLPSETVIPQPVLPPFLSAKGENASETESVVHRENQVRQKVYYERGKTVPAGNEVEAMLAQLPPERLVKKIAIHAYASVEGNPEENVRIFQKRADHLLEVLRQYKVTTGDVVLGLDTRENWALATTQLGDSLGLSSAEQSEVRKFFNDNRNTPAVARLLDEQRYSEVTLELTHPEKINFTPDTLVNRFNRIMASPNLKSEQLMQLQRLQLGYYRMLREKGSSKDFALLNIPEKGMGDLQFNRLMFLIEERLITGTEWLSELHKIGETQKLTTPASAFLIYNNLAFVFNHNFYSGDIDEYFPADTWQSVERSTHALHFKKIRSKKKDPRSTDLILLQLVPTLVKHLNRSGANADIIKKLSAFYLIRLINEYQKISEIKHASGITSLCRQFYRQHLATAELSDDERLRWSLYFNQFSERELSLLLLEPMVRRESPHPDGYKIWISLHHHKDHEWLAEQLLAAAKFLSRDDWQELVSSRQFLPLTILEDYRVRQIYQANLRQTR